MTDLITITIQSGVLILAILLIRKLFMGKINPILQYSIWILVALRLFIPVNIESTFSLLNAAKPYTQVLTAPVVQNTNNVPQIVQNTPGNIINNAANDPASQAEAAQTAAAAPAIDLMQILMFIWIAGMAAMFIYTLTINIRFYLFVKKNGRKENGIYICKNITSPCLMGVIKPVIVLNTKAANNKTSKKYAILHEETHLKHKDNIWAFARTAACIVYWFNPLVWIAANVCRKDQEIACDYSVIKQIGEHNKIEYGEVLISLIRKNKTLPSLTTGMANNKKDIKERLKLIARTPKMLKITAICLIILMIAVCVVSCTNAIALNQEAEQENLSTTANKNNVQNNPQQTEETQTVKNEVATKDEWTYFIYKTDGKDYGKVYKTTNYIDNSSISNAQIVLEQDVSEIIIVQDREYVSNDVLEDKDWLIFVNIEDNYYIYRIDISDTQVSQSDSGFVPLSVNSDDSSAKSNPAKMNNIRSCNIAYAPYDPFNDTHYFITFTSLDTGMNYWMFNDTEVQRKKNSDTGENFPQPVIPVFEKQDYENYYKNDAKKYIDIGEQLLKTEKLVPELKLGMTEDELIEKFGKPDKEEDVIADSYHNGHAEYTYTDTKTNKQRIEIEYVYKNKGFKAWLCKDKTGNYIVDMIRVELFVEGSSRFSTSRGIKIGDSVEDVLKAYGKEFNLYQTSEGYYEYKQFPEGEYWQSIIIGDNDTGIRFMIDPFTGVIGYIDLIKIPIE